MFLLMHISKSHGITQMNILWFKKMKSRVFQLGHMAVLHLLTYFYVLLTGSMSLKSGGSPQHFPFYMYLFCRLPFLD